jgi:uncharacterized integral membrane protein
MLDHEPYPALGVSYLFAAGLRFREFFCFGLRIEFAYYQPHGASVFGSA